jgi:diacylglycerol kinase (ATP)
MRAGVIVGLGSSTKHLKAFQSDKAIEWRMGMPSLEDRVDAVLVFGGDGTIHRHLNQLVRLQVPVLVVPAGSGNDFARALGFRHVRDSLSAWGNYCKKGENIKRIDLGTIRPLAESAPPHAGTRYFCCVAGVGLDGEVARRANNLPRWLRAHGGYALSVPPAIFTFAPFPMKISVTDSFDRSTGWPIRSDQPTILAAVANTPMYGDGMKIAPKAKMDDGQFDICVVGGVDPYKLFCLFPTVFRGNHLNVKEVSYFSAPQVRIETEHPLDVYADGEFVCRTPVEMAIEPACFNVIVP